MNKEEEAYANNSFKGGGIEILTNTVKGTKFLEHISTDNLNVVDKNKVLTLL